MAQSDETVPVKTYVDPEDKEIWQEEAEQLGMSQAEFVRSMVQAGRRGFDLDSVADPSATPDPGGETFEDRIAAAIESEGPLEYDEIQDHAEDWIADAIDALQEQNIISHNPRDGGYELRTDERD